MVRALLSRVWRACCWGPPLKRHCFRTAGFERVLQKESGTFKYYLKLVPTEYIKLDGAHDSSMRMG